MSEAQPTTGAPQPGAELDYVVSPLDRSKFLREYFHQRALHIPGPAKKFAFLDFDVERVFTAAEQLANDSGLCELGDEWPPRSRLQASILGELVIDGREVRQLSKIPESTVCVDRIDRLDPGLAQFAARFGASAGAVVGINCYYSSDGGGFPLHYVEHPVFIVQISGSKNWRFSREPQRRAPPDNFMIPAERRAEFPKEEELEAATLEPGGVLFLPAGTLHQGRGVGHSLGLTFAIQRKPFGRHLMAMLKRLDVWWLHEPLDLIGPTEQQSGPSPELRADLEQRLAGFREWANRVDVDQFWKQWVRVSAQTAAQVAAPKAPVELELELDTELRIASDSPVGLDVGLQNGRSHVVIQYAGRRIEFDCSQNSAKLLQSLLKRDRFRPSELEVPFAAIRGVLRLLMEIGVVQPG